MNYVEYVTVTGRTTTSIASNPDLYAMAVSLAHILDNDLFRIDLLKKTSYEMRRVVEQREKVFDDLCTVCAQLGIPTPPLEPELYKFLIPDDFGQPSEEAIAITKYVYTALGLREDPAAQLCRAAVRVNAAFPMMSKDFPGLSSKIVVALVNATLVPAGYEPIRNIRTKTHVSLRTDEDRHPFSAVSVLIFDDSTYELMKSAYALAGWPLVTTCCKQYQSETLRDAANSILAVSPDIVLMDKELGPMAKFHGNDVIREMYSLCEEQHKIMPVVVANTGGDPQELFNVGAIGNFDKGSRTHAVREAIRAIKNRRMPAIAQE